MAVTDTKATVTIKALAVVLKTDPRTLRAFLRRHNLGSGRGVAYSWTSMNDPVVKRIQRLWEKDQIADEVTTKAP